MTSPFDAVTAVTLILGSQHIGVPPDVHYNQTNLGVSIEAVEPWFNRSLSLGYVHRNSHSKPTVFGTVELVGVSSSALRSHIGVFAGVGTGYRQPWLGGVNAIIWDYASITYVPKVGDYNHHTLIFGLRIPLK